MKEAHACATRDAWAQVKQKYVCMKSGFFCFIQLLKIHNDLIIKLECQNCGHRPMGFV